MAKLHARNRNALPDSAFAVPAKRKLPIHDASHALAASRMVGRTDGISDREKALARQRIATAVAHFSHKEIDGTASGSGDYKDVMCDACEGGVPSACMCDACEGGVPSKCMCDRAATAQLRKDYDTGMGLQPYYIDGQHRIKDASGNDLPDALDKAADLDGPVTYISLAAKYDRNTHIVDGIASNEAIDSDQQIADKGWLDVALPEWMKWGNMRQMHQPIAAGKALRLEEEGTGYRLTSKVVNPETVRLFDEGVLQAYSIGIRNPVIVRDPVAKNGRIVGGKIVEVSYVDHPANPDSRVAISKFADGVLSPLTTQIEELPMEASGMLESFKNAQPSPAPDLDALAARQAAASKDAADGDKPPITPTSSGASSDAVGQVERMTADAPTPMSADQLLTELATLEHRQAEVKAQLDALSRGAGGKPGSLFDLPGGNASQETTLQPLATPEQSWHGGPMKSIEPERLKAAVAEALGELLNETLTKDASEMAKSPLLKFLDAAVAVRVGDVTGRLEAIERMAAPLRGVTTEKVLANAGAVQPSEAEQALITLSKAARAGQLSEADQLKAAAAINAERMRARFGTN